MYVFDEPQSGIYFESASHRAGTEGAGDAVVGFTIGCHFFVRTNKEDRGNFVPRALFLDKGLERWAAVIVARQPVVRLPRCVKSVHRTPPCFRPPKFCLYNNLFE